MKTFILACSARRHRCVGPRCCLAAGSPIPRLDPWRVSTGLGSTRRPYGWSTAKLTNETARPQVLDLGPRLFFGFNKKPRSDRSGGARVSILSLPQRFLSVWQCSQRPRERHG